MINKLEVILDAYPDIEFLSADGFDDAIIGVSNDFKLVYSSTKCFEILMKSQNLTYDDAQEYYYFNVEGAYMGENTPIFVDDELFKNK